MAGLGQKPIEDAEVFKKVIEEVSDGKAKIREGGGVIHVFVPIGATHYWAEDASLRTVERHDPNESNEFQPLPIGSVRYPTPGNPIPADNKLIYSEITIDQQYAVKPIQKGGGLPPIQTQPTRKKYVSDVVLGYNYILEGLIRAGVTTRDQCARVLGKHGLR